MAYRFRPGRGQRGSIVPGGVRAETEQAIANLESLLSKNGASLSSVAKTTVFMTDIANFGAINEVYGAAFKEPRPARSAVAVAGLPLGASVEIEAWAYLPGEAAG